FGGCGEILSLGAPNHSFDQKMAINIGQHSIKFGGVYFRRNLGRSNIENPNFSYQNEADLLANTPNGVTFTFGVDPYTATAHEFGLFVQDDWKITRTLVLNLGLRYDFFGHYVAHGPDGGPPNSFNRAGFVDDQFTLGPVRDINDPYDNDAMNLAPRLGFSYNPDGRGRTVIRGGASTMFTNLAGETVTQTVQNSLTEPFRSSFSRQEALDFGIRYPFYNADALPLVSGGTGLGGSPRVLDPRMQAAYAINFYLGVQREITTNMALETAYVGVRGVKWQTSRNANLPNRFTGVRPNPLFATMDYWDNADNTWYNAWQTSLRKRYSHNISTNFHYTWSKAISYGSGDTGWTGSNAQDFFDLRSNRGLADGSVLHSFVADVVYDLPRLRDTHALLRHTIGGWQISGIALIQGGAPILITQPTGLSGSRPDYIGGPPTLDDARETLQYLNRAAFEEVPVNSFRAGIRPGNLGRNAVRRPGQVNFDISLGKNFAITERYRLQFRADMFNAFNHTNLSDIETNIQSANFGRITSTRGAREIQLNARFSF
ncbi:MAG: TonB-dependent receptor domain-containing protein, partial [Bryobacteraceae bacterium]